MVNQHISFWPEWMWLDRVGTLSQAQLGLPELSGSWTQSVLPWRILPTSTGPLSGHALGQTPGLYLDPKTQWDPRETILTLVLDVREL